MKKLWIVLTLFLTLVITLTTLEKRNNPEERDQEHHKNTDAKNRNLIEGAGSRTPPPQNDTRLTRAPSGRVEYNPALETSRAITPTTSPRQSLALLEQLLSHYRFAYQENPVGGENFEITEQLLGKNPKQIVFIARDSAALRGNELIDQWGTPYFFHAISGQHMEIRSAGPDQTLWTDDDVFTTKQP